MGFNTAVLEGIKRQAIEGYSPDPLARAAIESTSLSLSMVAQFSQVMRDAFAGPSWFELVAHLDDDRPGPCHAALAQLALAGRLAAIVTTNFDTLLEQAFTAAGAPFTVHPPTGELSTLDPGDPCRIVKVHGTVRETSSLVDLAAQKTRGLPEVMRAWLSRAYAEHPVLVLGFSGADLDLADDYLGFDAAAALIPWMRWLARPGRAPHPAAQAAVDRIPAAEFVEGELPDALKKFGISVPDVAGAGRAAPNPREWVDRWLRQPHMSREASAATCARLLQYAGADGSAEVVRSMIRHAADASKAAPLSLRGIYEAHAFALMGADLVGRDTKQAIADLERARISDYAATSPDSPFGAEARAEQVTNLKNVLANLALAHIANGDHDGALEPYTTLGRVVEDSEPPFDERTRARGFLISGHLHRLSGRPRDALIGFRTATDLAKRAGDLGVQGAALIAQAQVAALFGEPDLAALLLADGLRRTAPLPGAPSPSTEFLEASAAPVEALLKRLSQEAASSETDRFDEVLYSAWQSLSAQDDLGRLRDHLATLDAVSPMNRVLVAVARHQLTDTPDDAIVEQVGPLLVDFTLSSLEHGALPLGAYPVLPDGMRDALRMLGLRWAQWGRDQHSEGRWGDAARGFMAGGTALVLAGDRVTGTRAYLYLTDAYARVIERRPLATALLRGLALTAPPELNAAVESRLVKIAAAESAATGQVTPALRAQAASGIDRLRRIGDSDSLGAALLAVAQLSAAAGDGPAAWTELEEAADCFGSQHAVLIEALRQRFRDAGLDAEADLVSGSA
jgi:hypothetical protein